MANTLNVDRLTQVLSEILSEKHGLEITVTAVPRGEEPEDHGGVA